jgi:hypothetical protein
MDSYTRSLQNVAKANQEIVNKNLGVTDSYKSAEQSAESFIRVLDNQVRSARAATAALNERVGITGPSATDSGAGFAALEGQMERLRTKYDSVYASSRIYENGLNEINQAHIMGAISSKQHEAALEQLNMEYQQFQGGAVTGMNRFVQGAQQSASRMNQMGVVVQQTGYQVGDFLVQIQSGTNWMVAFGQQATQLVGVLPMLSGSLGISSGSLIAVASGLGIAIPLLTAIGAVFMRTGDAAKEGAKDIDLQKQAYDALIESIRSLRLEEQTSASGMTSEQQRVLNDLNALQAQRLVLTYELEDANRRLNEQVDSFYSEDVERVTNSLTSLDAEIAKRQRALDVYKELLENQAKEKSQQAELALQYATYYNSRVAGEKQVAEASEAYYRGILAVQAAHQKVLNLARDLDKELGEGAAAALKLAGIDISKPLAAGAAQAGAIAANLGVAYNQAVGLMGVFNRLTSGGDERGSQRGTVMGANTRNPEQPWLDSYTRGGWIGMDDKGGGGGGGGNGQLDALIGQLQTEREVLEAWYAESQTLLQSASDSELSIVGGKHEALVRLEEEYQSKLKAIRDAGSSTALGDASIFFEGMAAIAAAGGNKTVKAMRIFSAAQALINSYVAFTEVLKDPSFIGRPWARFGAAAKALASGLAAVNAIKGGGGGGISGGGGSPGTSSVASSGQQQQAQTVYIDSIEPDALYSGQTLMNLFDAFYNENDRRGKVFIVGR